MSLGPISRILLLALVASACTPVAISEAPVRRLAPPLAAESYANLPLSFIENRGQVANDEVAHYVQTPPGSIGFTPTGLRVRLPDTAGTSQAWALAMDFVGGRADPVAEDRRQGVVSYFSGDQEDWRTGLSTHGRIVYRDLWEGIDLVYRADGPKLKYEFLVHPGADPDDIRLRWRGATGIAIRSDGSLAVRTPAGSLSDAAPTSFQGSSTVDTSYTVEGATVGFRVAPYDRGRTLRIDPVVTTYAGYIGGDGEDYVRGVAVDPAGNAYVVGHTPSDQTSFPVTVGPDATYNGGSADAFVAKVNPSGVAFAYVGYIGGSGTDVALAIAVDDAGAASIAGSTATADGTFPIVGGLDPGYNGGPFDGFVAKINPQGTGLIYSGFVGGNMSDSAKGIALDPSGAAYLAGDTSSTDFGKVGPDVTYNLGPSDAFVAKVDPQGTSLIYAGYIGGDSFETGLGIAVDGAGAAYVAGDTGSTLTFPATGGPDLMHNGGTEDAYVAKVNPAGTGLVYAGYIGGDQADYAYGIDVDAAGAAYVVGDTGSLPATFPEAVGPSLTYGGGSYDAYIAKVDPSGATLQYAGYIGGAESDGANGVVVDGQGRAHVTGGTSSDASTFPEIDGPSLTYGGGGDAYVAKLSAQGTAFVYAGYLGGAAVDTGVAIALDPTGAAYIAGLTLSDAASFPDSVGPVLTKRAGLEGFVARITDNLCLGAGVTIQGTAGNETITGTAGADVILGLGGNDVIDGAGGNDVICAGDGEDTLVGGAGNDGLDGEAGIDTVSFPVGPVTADLAVEDSGGGVAIGEGHDIFANTENLNGSPKKDVLRGSAGPNTIRGGGGADRIVGRAGKDRLLGQKGKDRLVGGDANDRLSGGKGNDRMNGGRGKNDRCNGGKGGADTASNCEKVSGVP